MPSLSIIKVADFARIPGARHYTDGDNSAEEFFDTVVKNIADVNLLQNDVDKVLIDFDQTVGYPSSFVSELAKLMSENYKKAKKSKKRILIKSDEDPGIIQDFWNGFNEKY